MPPKIWTVILSWNGREDTMACLESLRKQTLQPEQIIVIDNGSQDGLEQPLRLAFPRVRYHYLPQNIGFGAGMNLGIRMAMDAGAEYIMTLNNDAWLEPECLERLLSALSETPAAAAVSPKIYLPAPSGNIYFNGGFYTRLTLKPKHAGENRPDPCPGDQAVRDIEFLNGCCPLFRSAALAQVGLYDPAFFAYFEDADLSWRLRRAGWRLLLAARAKAVHRSGHSFQQNAGPRPQGTTTPGKWFLNTRNRLWFLRRHGTPLQKLAGIPLVLAAYLGIALLLLARLRPAKAEAVAKGIWQGLFTSAGRSGMVIPG